MKVQSLRLPKQRNLEARQQHTEGSVVGQRLVLLPYSKVPGSNPGLFNIIRVLSLIPGLGRTVPAWVSSSCSGFLPPSKHACYSHQDTLAQCDTALSCSSSGLTLHSNLTILLYYSLYNDSKAAFPLPLEGL